FMHSCGRSFSAAATFFNANCASARDVAQRAATCSAAPTPPDARSAVRCGRSPANRTPDSRSVARADPSRYLAETWHSATIKQQSDLSAVLFGLHARD